MDYRLLGSFEVLRAGEALPLGGHRQRAVLAILLLAANSTVSTDSLVDQVWSGAPPPGATGTLRAYVSNLRRLLEPERSPRTAARVLTSVQSGYRLVVPDGARDVDRFTSSSAAARTALTTGDPATAVRCAQQGLAEWRGPALADFVDEPFAAGEILRLEEARLQTMELRIDAELALGRHDQAIAELAALVNEHPLRERLRGQLMLALYRSGRQAEALEVARVGRERLADELGIDPDPALNELHAAILRQDPALAAPTEQWLRAPAAPRPQTRAAVPATDPPGGALIGRWEEREVLGRALAAATRGTGRVVLIGGEPGIGKTTLVEAFAAEIDAARVLWGRCDQTGGAPPLWPWRQVLRSLAAELGGAALQEILGADAGVVCDVVPELAEALGDVPVVRLPDAEAARFHLFDGVTRLLTTAARERPAVVLLEDIHWADEPSLGLLRFVVGAIRGSRLLIVGTYRHVAGGDPSALSATLGALAREPMVERLLLPGLAERDSTALIGHLLGDAPDDRLVDAMLERTDGNPLFMLHLARLLRGALDRGGEDALEIVRSHIPPAVIDLIGLRVAELPELTRRLLEVAAIAGRSFELELIVRVEAASFDAALDAVEPAVAGGLVVEEERTGTYRFTHALLREAIVADLGRSRAGRLHGLVADALSSGGVDSQLLPALAHHYWEAAPVGWADAALESATAAAGAAMAGLAYEDAQEHLDRAAQLLQSRPAGEKRDRAELAVCLQRATHLMRTRGYAVPDVADACHRARELAASLRAPAEHLIASWGLAAHHLVRSEHNAAIAIGAELLDVADRTGNPVAAQAGHQVTGVPSFYLGRPADAAHHLERAIETARSLPPDVLARFPQNVEVGAMAFLAAARWLLGDAAESEELRLDALTRSRRLGGYDEVFVLMVSAQLGVLRRDADKVVSDSTAMLARCGEAGFQHVAAHARIMGGWAVALTGQPAAGLSMLESGLAYFAASESSTRRSHNLTLFAEALALAGRREEAQAAIDAAVRELDGSEERFYGPETWMVRARLLGDGPPVRGDLERALAAAEETGAVPLRQRAFAALQPESALDT